MVELEVIKEGLYFRYKGAVIRVDEVHYPFLPAMRMAMDPIPLERNEFFMLGFEFMSNNELGELKKRTQNGRLFWVKKSPRGSGWTFGIDSADTQVEILHVNELQEIYLSLFREVLRRRGDEPRPREKMVYRLMGDVQVSVPTTTDTNMGRHYGKMNRYNEILPYQEQLYYLTWDCSYLIRNIQYTIWKVTFPDDPTDVLFEHMGKSWGLSLIAGKGTSLEHTRAAGRWLQQHLRENDLKNG